MNEKKPLIRVAWIGARGIPANYGGFESFLENVIKVFNGQFEHHVTCSAKYYKVKPRYWGNAILYYLPFDSNGWASIFYDAIGFLKLVRKADVFIFMGYAAGFLFPVFKIICWKKPIILNLGGIENLRTKWNRIIRLGVSIVEQIACKYATLVISDNKGIQEYLNKSRGISSVVIPYGGDHALNSNKKFKEWPDTLLSALRTKYVLTICRIEPENNIEMLIKGFLHSKAQKYILVGNWNATPYGKTIYKRYEKESRLLCPNPIYDLSLLNQLRTNCIAYLHGHSVGGTNPSLVEAMFFNRPIIAFDVSFNRYTTDNLALYFDSAKDLTKIINQTISGIHDDVGSKLAQLALNQYTWLNIAEQYKSLIIQTVSKSLLSKT